MPNKTLTQDEMDDVIVEFYKAQEMDLYIHQINKSRYEEMLKSLPLGKFRTKVEGLLSETNDRIAEVSAILAATEKQLPTDTRIQSALARLQTKQTE